MRKSKYLILSGFYFDFNDELSKIIEIKKSFEKQNILDLYRFDDIDNLYIFKNKNIYFLYLSKIFSAAYNLSFSSNQIEILDLSQCINLKFKESDFFVENQIKYFRFPKNIDTINCNKILYNNIDILDLSQCKKLKSIDEYSFFDNEIKKLKLSDNIEIIKKCAFLSNQIEILDLSQCINLKYIGGASFEANKIKQLKLPKNIEIIDNFAFSNNQIEILDLSNCIKLKEIKNASFGHNPLKEIKILDNIEIEYYNYLNDNDKWNKFCEYYKNNKEKSGDYKLENDKWKWYSL